MGAEARKRFFRGLNSCGWRIRARLFMVCNEWGELAASTGAK
jgi:hypothetical protein